MEHLKSSHRTQYHEGHNTVFIQRSTFFTVDTCADEDSALTFGFGQDRYVCESYYFALHVEKKYNRHKGEILFRSISDTLSGWVNILENPSNTSVIYLPFELSDQYSRWIECKKEKETLEMSIGFCSLEGYALNLEHPEWSQHKLVDYQRTSDQTILVGSNEFRQWLFAAIKVFDAADLTANQ